MLSSLKEKKEKAMMKMHFDRFIDIFIQFASSLQQSTLFLLLLFLKFKSFFIIIILRNCTTHFSTKSVTFFVSFSQSSL